MRNKLINTTKHSSLQEELNKIDELSRTTKEALIFGLVVGIVIGSVITWAVI